MERIIAFNLKSIFMLISGTLLEIKVKNIAIYIIILFF